MSPLRLRYGLRWDTDRPPFPVVLLKVDDIVLMTLAILSLLLLYGWMAARDAEAVEADKAWSHLVVVYLAVNGSNPEMKIHRVERSACNSLAKQIYNNVKAGKVRAFCFKGKPE